MSMGTKRCRELIADLSNRLEALERKVEQFKNKEQQHHGKLGSGSPYNPESFKHEKE